MLRCVDHHYVLWYVTHASHGVLLGPALPYGLLGDFGGLRCVQATVGYGVDVGEFLTDHKRLLWTRRKFLSQPQGASPGYGDGARTLLHTSEGEDPLGQLLHHLGLWVLLQLGVWVGRCGSGARPAPLRQDAFVHLLSTPSCDSVVGHTNTLRKLGSTPHRFLPPLLRERVAANMAGQD